MASDETCFHGDVCIQYISKDTGEVLNERSVHNLIVNSGREAMARMLCSNSTNYDSHSIDGIVISYYSASEATPTATWLSLTQSPNYHYSTSVTKQNLTSRIEATATFQGDRLISESGAEVGAAGTIAWHSIGLFITTGTTNVLFSRVSDSTINTGWGTDKIMKIIWTISYG